MKSVKTANVRVCLIALPIAAGQTDVVTSALALVVKCVRIKPVPHAAQLAPQVPVALPTGVEGYVPAPLGKSVRTASA